MGNLLEIGGIILKVKKKINLFLLLACLFYQAHIAGKSIKNRLAFYEKEVLIMHFQCFFFT